MRVAARRRGTYWVRFGFAAMAIGIAAVILLGTLRQTPMQQAQILFAILSMLAFLYALFAGALATSDCVSEEKREGTLGLLFLTSLRGYDVVVGKVMASSLRAVSGLVALIPILAVPLLMGSIGGDLVRNTALVLVNTMFLSLSVGVLVSVLARDPRHAVGGAIFGMIFLIGLIPLGRWIFIEYVLIDALHLVTRGAGESEALAWLLYSNPFMLFSWSGQNFMPAAAAQKFWVALGVQHAIAWGCLVLACVLVPRSWRDRTEVRTRRSRTAPVSGVVAEGVAEPVRAQARGGSDEDRGVLLDELPFGWIVTRDRRARWFTWAGLGVVAGVWLWGYFEVKEDWLQAVVGLTTLFVAGGWLKVRLAASACRHLHENRRSGALELVLCTAQTPDTVLRGYLDGLRRILLSPLATVLAAGGLLMVAAAGQDRGASDLGELAMTFVVGAGLLLLDLWTLAWTGMWNGMRSARYVRAWTLTLGQVLFLPWALFVLSAVLVTVAIEVLDLAPTFDPGYGGMLIWWVGIAVGVDALFLIISRTSLRRRFRDLAVEHYGPLPAAGGVAGKPS